MQHKHHQPPERRDGRAGFQISNAGQNAGGISHDGVSRPQGNIPAHTGTDAVTAGQGRRLHKRQHARAQQSESCGLNREGDRGGWPTATCRGLRTAGFAYGHPARLATLLGARTRSV